MHGKRFETFLLLFSLFAVAQDTLLLAWLINKSWGDKWAPLTHTLFWKENQTHFYHLFFLHEWARQPNGRPSWSHQVWLGPQNSSCNDKSLFSMQAKTWGSLLIELPGFQVGCNFQILPSMNNLSLSQTIVVSKLRERTAAWNTEADSYWAESLICRVEEWMCVSSCTRHFSPSPPTPPAYPTEMLWKR